MLQNGGDLQLKMMSDVKMEYDATMPSEAYGFMSMGQGLWPYSFDYASTQVLFVTFWGEMIAF